MPTRDIKTRVSLEGAKEYSANVKSCNSSLKEYKSELKLAEATYKESANSMEALSKKGEILQKMYDTQSQKVDTLNRALDEAKGLQSGYAEQVEQARAALQKAQEEMAAYAESSQQSADEQERLQQALDEAQKELDDSSESYNKSTELVSKYQTQVNQASAELISMDGDLKENRRYMDEASKSADGCAQSIDKYGKQVGDAGDASGKLSGVTEELRSRLENIFTTGGIVAGAVALAKGLWDCATAGAEFADEILTLSAKTGLATDTLQEFQYMENLVDTDLSTITGSLRKLTANMDSARSGSGSAADAFEKLGIKVTDSNGQLRSSEDVFYEVLDALGGIANETERDVTAMDLFGKSAQDLNPLIAAGSDGLKDYAKEAHEVGYVLDNETLQALSDMDDAMERMRQKWAATKNQLGANIAPIVNDMLDAEAKVRKLSEETPSDFFDVTDAENNPFRTWAADASDAAGAVGELTDATQDLADASSAAADAEAARVAQEEANIAQIDEHKAKLEELNAAWQEEWEQIRANVETQIGLFQDMDVQVDTSVGKMVDSLKSQSDYMATYAANLQKAAELGIDKGLLKQLADGTVQSAEYLQAIVDDGGEKIEELNEAFRTVEEGKDDFATVLQDASSDLKTQMTQMVVEVQNGVRNMDQSGLAYSAGVNTAQGLINGINSKQAAVASASANLGRIASEAYNRTMVIRSPSKVMEWSGEMSGEGVIKGVEKKVPDAAKAFTELAQANAKAYNDQMAKVSLSGIDAAVSRFAGRVGRASAAPAAPTNITNNYVQNAQRAAGGVVRVELTTNLDGRAIAKTVRDVDLSTASRFGR